MTDGLVFDPDSVTVALGTMVVWENVGSITVQEGDGGTPGGESLPQVPDSALAVGLAGLVAVITVSGWRSSS